jgi:hemolysin III
VKFSHPEQGSAVVVAPPKPRLRGWSHALAALAAVVVTVILLVRTYHDLPRFVSLLIFGLSMILLYVVSAIYHIGPWQGRARARWRAFDHANIYLLIAGTYTPFCVNVLSGTQRIVVLSVIWSLGIAGAVGTMATLNLPRWLSTSLYLGMGWIAVWLIPSLLQALSWGGLGMLLLGGLLYTSGAIVYAFKRPNPLPRTFGFHEIFHLFTIAAGAAFIVAVWVWVVPFPRV